MPCGSGNVNGSRQELLTRRLNKHTIQGNWAANTPFTVSKPPSIPDHSDPRHDRQLVTQRTLRSDELLQGQVEVLIQHGLDTYRLRLTRSGKLILQK